MRVSPLAHPPRCVFPGFLLLALFLLLPSPGMATTVIELGVEQLVERSDRIVHAVCTYAHSYRDAEGRIVTRYEFQAQETLKGSHEATFAIVQPGGRVGTVQTIIPGLSSYRMSDEVVLFLGQVNPRSGFRLPLGLDQGIYRVKSDPQSGQRVVRRNLTDLHFVRAPQQASPEQLPEGISVSQFKAEVRNRLSANPSPSDR